MGRVNEIEQRVITHLRKFGLIEMHPDYPKMVRLSDLGRENENQVQILISILARGVHRAISHGMLHSRCSLATSELPEPNHCFKDFIRPGKPVENGFIESSMGGSVMSV
jgi:SOS-response transcriptional repressor LexA